MIIAQQLKGSNIAEYLLYMWQIEDMIRACNLEDEKMEQLLVARFSQMEGITPDMLQHIREWYFNLRDMMLSEGKRESGHLQINENVLIDLTDLHLMLLRHGQDAIYTSCYYSTLPHIVELRSKEGDDKKGELETCFIALYGVMIMNLKKAAVNEETKVATSQIAKFMALLSQKYRQWKAGELELDDDKI